MLGKTVAGTSALVFAALMMAGCSDDAQAQPKAATPPEATQTDATADASACAAVSDVMTILENADMALREGRMAAQEQQGWYRIATRVLDSIPTDDDGAVNRGVSELQEIAPAVRAGTGAEPVGLGTKAWHETLATLAGPCTAAGSELTIGMFTGG